MLNKIFIMGRLTRDPELRFTESGNAVVNFSLACERDFKEKDGSRATDFVECIAWRNTAEFVSKHFSKGRMAVVEGRLQMRDWKDKNGNNRRAAEIQVDNIYFGDSKPQDNGSYSGYAAHVGKFNSAPQFAEVDDEEDVPFKGDAE